MGDMNNNGNEQDNEIFEPIDTIATVPLPSYNKKKTKNIMVIAIAAVLLVSAVAGFLFKDHLSNQLMLLIKNPTEYYAYVENKSLSSGIDSITKNYSASIEQYKKLYGDGYGVDFAMELSVSPEFAGLYALSDIGNVKLNANISYKDLKQQMNTEILYKDQSLAHLNALFNLEDETYYLQVPELSNAYLLFSINELMEQNGLYMDSESSSDLAQYQKLLVEGTISPEQLNQLLKNYSSIILDGIKNVEHNSDTTLSISGNSAKYTSLTVQISADDMYEIGLNILNTAKEDKDLKEMVVSAGFTTDEEYDQSVDGALITFEENKDTLLADTSTINMTVYVDGSGAIIGREFALAESTDTLGYYSIRKGTNINFTAYYKQESGAFLDITGNATYAGDKISGTADINYDDTYDSFAATLDFKDLAISANSQYVNGSMTLTSDTFDGISVGLDLVGNSESQALNFKMLYGNIEGINLNISSKLKPYKEITIPAASDEIYDANTDIYSYMESMDLEGFINHVYDVTGIDLNSLMYGLSGF